MTREQFKDIQERLAKWREERGLSVEDQVKKFKINYTEEFLEYLEAEKEGNEYEMIDTICNMCVVCINAGAWFSINSYETSLNFPIYQKGYEPKDDDFSILYTDLLRPLCEYATPMGGLRTIGLYPLFLQLVVRGYDPYKCLLETIKELDSITGKWSGEEGKLIKDYGAYTKEESVKNAEEYCDCGFLLNMCVLKEDENFWLVGEVEEEIDEEQSLEEIKEAFQGVCVKVKKWYKADYEKCKI